MPIFFKGYSSKELNSKLFIENEEFTRVPKGTPVILIKVLVEQNFKILEKGYNFSPVVTTTVVNNGAGRRRYL